jgi:hypothetical protein
VADERFARVTELVEQTAERLAAGDAERGALNVERGRLEEEALRLREARAAHPAALVAFEEERCELSRALGEGTRSPAKGESRRDPEAGAWRSVGHGLERRTPWEHRWEHAGVSGGTPGTPDTAWKAESRLWPRA